MISRTAQWVNVHGVEIIKESRFCPRVAGGYCKHSGSRAVDVYEGGCLMQVLVNTSNFARRRKIVQGYIRYLENKYPEAVHHEHTQQLRNRLQIIDEEEYVYLHLGAASRG